MIFHYWYQLRCYYSYNKWKQRMESMKIFKKLVATVLLISTTVAVASEDYALTEEYKLLNDMKMVKEQQADIVSMSKLIEAKEIDIQKIEFSVTKFDSVIHGLIGGDKKMKLNGTKIPQIRRQLTDLLVAWNESKLLLKSNLNDGHQKQKVINNLNTILIKVSQTVALYNQSYSRYKQRSRLSSIVNRHMNNSHRTFALNTVY